MANVGYKAVTAGGAIALSASATKTILGVKAHANSGLQVIKWGVSFDGSAAAAGVAVQLMYTTWATNSPGTNSTTTNAIVQEYGRVLTAGFTAGYNWTTEPTVLTELESKYIQQSGAYEWSIPLGKEPDCALAEGFVVRVITPAAVTPNIRGFLGVERI
jgi:hypothetical protein